MKVHKTSRCLVLKKSPASVIASQGHMFFKLKSMLKKLRVKTVSTFRMAAVVLLMLNSVMCILIILHQFKTNSQTLRKKKRKNKNLTEP